MRRATRRSGWACLASGDDEACWTSCWPTRCRLRPCRRATCRATTSSTRPASGSARRSGPHPFQVTDQVPLELLRAKAQEVLDALQADPRTFAATAGALSNCPFRCRGRTAGASQPGARWCPEFEQVVHGSGARLGAPPGREPLWPGTSCGWVTATKGGNSLSRRCRRRSAAPAGASPGHRMAPVCPPPAGPGGHPGHRAARTRHGPGAVSGAADRRAGPAGLA